jgi:hypothetical protein
MSNKQQTAVEWYNEQLNLYGDMAFNKEITLGEYHIKKQELIKQAKEIEKEQMLECYLKADVFPRKYEFEQYYNETYGGK